jgi:hypothetical protein
MAASMAGAVARIKRGPAEALGRERVRAVCRELGHRWRDRELDPATTVALFVQQVLHGNAPCSEVRHLGRSCGIGRGRGDFTASAYCQARKRLPLELLRRLGDDVATAALEASGAMGPSGEGGRWLGHRTLLIDGTSFSTPDTPQLRSHYGKAGGMREGVGFPASHLLVLFDAGTGLLLHADYSPLDTSDLSGTPAAHRHLRPGDVLVGDGHFGSYAHLALLSQRGCHGLFPVHHRRVVDFTPRRPHAPPGRRAAAPDMPRSRWVRSLGRDDQLVEYFKPVTRSPWLTKGQWDALPESVVVREVRRTVDRGELGAVTLTMVTTLTDPQKYPAEAPGGRESLVQLRLGRWAVETDIAHLKTTMGMHALRCRTVGGVQKELAAFRLVYNLVRVVILEAAARQAVAPDRVSFADALRWARHARPGDEMPTLLVNPRRKGRVEPRAVKRRPKVYDRLSAPREEYRQTLRNRAVHA